MTPLEIYFQDAPRGEKARLARALEMSAGAFGHLIHGRREPTLSQARRIHLATAGKCPMGAWLDEKSASLTKSPWKVA